jgi:endoglucanase
MTWISRWVRERRNLKLLTDKAGNLLITRTRKTGSGPRRPPLIITAHLDHPAFVVVGEHGPQTIALQFRGGVHDHYFEHARIEVFDADDRAHSATLIELDSAAKPFKRVIARLDTPTASLKPGDVGRWLFPDEAAADLPRVENGMLRTHACDDLAAVAAALAALDILRSRRGCEHIGLLFTRAEEIGFIGAIAACRHRTVSRTARLICLENSRSFAESPIGGGPIVRVGDKMSVFEPTLTNDISLLMAEQQKTDPTFKWQRRLMPGGTCEATTFSTFGYRSTCLCLPLGNFHNMCDIDAASAGQRPARVGPEYISVDDYHGLIRMLIICGTQLDSAELPSLRTRMNDLIRQYGFVLRES